MNLNSTITNIASFLSCIERLPLRLVSPKWLHCVSGKEKGDVKLPLCENIFPPLMMYCMDGNLPAVKFCVENGASPHGLHSLEPPIVIGITVTIFLYSPLGNASQYGHLSIVKYLMTKLVDPCEIDGYALQMAAVCGHIDVINWFLQKTIDDMILNKCLCIITHSYNECNDITTLLLDAGADIHHNKDCTLRYAVYNRDYELVKLLLARGADPMAIINDDDGVGPKERGFDDIESIIAEAIILNNKKK